MSKQITMKFEVCQDTPSEVQARARELSLSGLTMMRDLMIADGHDLSSPDLVLILDMLGELDQYAALDAELGATVRHLEAEIAHK